MSNFTLGRIGLDADIDDVSVWDQNGETVQVAFSTPSIGEGGTLLRANAYRQMLLGYVDDPDQRFVAVTWADDPKADGYYRVAAAQVSPDPDLGFDGLYYFTATLLRVRGYSQPAIQTTYLFHERTNVHDQSAVAYLGRPNTATQWGYTYEPEDGTRTGATSAHVVVSSEGGVDVTSASIVGGSGPAVGELALSIRQIDPSGYYVGAARLEVNGFPVEGRQIPRGWEGNWRLTNGVTELTHAAAGVSADDAIFQMRGWLNGAWSDPLAITLRGDDSAATPRDPFNGPDTLTILKNSAEEVTIRFAIHVGARETPTFLDITCRRGIRTLVYRLRKGATAFPAISVPNHLTDYGWRREGAWVSAGALVDTNYMWNPRCLLDGTYWDRVASTGTATGRITGLTVGSTGITTAFRCTATGAHVATGFGVEQGLTGSTTPNNGFVASTQYTFAAWVRCSAARSIRLRASWRTSAGALISSSDSADTAVSANTWTQITVTATAPANTARVSVQATGVSGGPTWATSDTLDMTGLQAETGTSVAAFWDGDDTASDAFNSMYATNVGPNAQSLKFDRTGEPTYWIVSPIVTQQDTDGWEPDSAVDSDPTIWDFGIGMMASGLASGDQGRYIREVSAYFMTITQTDDVVAV